MFIPFGFSFLYILTHTTNIGIALNPLPDLPEDLVSIILEPNIQQDKEDQTIIYDTQSIRIPVEDSSEKLSDYLDRLSDDHRYKNNENSIFNATSFKNMDNISNNHTIRESFIENIHDLGTRDDIIIKNESASSTVTPEVGLTTRENDETNHEKNKTSTNSRICIGTYCFNSNDVNFFTISRTISTLDTATALPNLNATSTVSDKKTHELRAESYKNNSVNGQLKSVSVNTVYLSDDFGKKLPNSNNLVAQTSKNKNQETTFDQTAADTTTNNLLIEQGNSESLQKYLDELLKYTITAKEGLFYKYTQKHYNFETNLKKYAIKRTPYTLAPKNIAIEDSILSKKSKISNEIVNEQINEDSDIKTENSSDISTGKQITDFKINYVAPDSLDTAADNLDNKDENFEKQLVDFDFEHEKNYVNENIDTAKQHLFNTYALNDINNETDFGDVTQLLTPYTLSSNNVATENSNLVNNNDILSENSDMMFHTRDMLYSDPRHYNNTGSFNQISEKQYKRNFDLPNNYDRIPDNLDTIAENFEEMSDNFKMPFDNHDTQAKNPDIKTEKFLNAEPNISTKYNLVMPQYQQLLSGNSNMLSKENIPHIFQKRDETYQTRPHSNDFIANSAHINIHGLKKLRQNYNHNLNQEIRKTFAEHIDINKNSVENYDENYNPDEPSNVQTLRHKGFNKKYREDTEIFNNDYDENDGTLKYETTERVNLDIENNYNVPDLYVRTDKVDEMPTPTDYYSTTSSETYTDDIFDPHKFTSKTFGPKFLKVLSVNNELKLAVVDSQKGSTKTDPRDVIISDDIIISKQDVPSHDKLKEIRRFISYLRGEAPSAKKPVLDDIHQGLKVAPIKCLKDENKAYSAANKFFLLANKKISKLANNNVLGLQNINHMIDKTI